MSDDYNKMKKSELIDLAKTLENELIELTSANISLNDTIRELDVQIEGLEARLTREQFAHEMTCEESEQFRKDLLDARLEHHAVGFNKRFWINSNGDKVRIKYFNPPF